jgi:hypothetical protein
MIVRGYSGGLCWWLLLMFMSEPGDAIYEG